MGRPETERVAATLRERYPELVTYDYKEIAALTGIPKSTLYDAMDSGELKYIVPKGKVKGRRIRLSAVAEWLESAEVAREHGYAVAG